MKFGIFTGDTSVRSKNIFTDIYRYSTGKHEIKRGIFKTMYRGLCKPKEKNPIKFGFSTTNQFSIALKYIIDNRVFEKKKKKTD